MTDNGSAPATTAPPKVDFDAGKLTPWDLLRARKMLAGQDPEVGGGQDSFALMDDPLYRNPLVYWCLATRVAPAFTWQQALETPYEVYVASGDEPDPQTARPAEPGVSPAKPGEPPSSKKPSGSAGGKSAATTTA